MMVVIGIDFGNDSCVVSVFRNGRQETVLNDFNVRNTPSIVSFSQRKRDIGVAAKNQWLSNVDNTVFDLKNTLGLTLRKKWKFNIVRIIENSKDLTLCFDASILNHKYTFSPYQVLAMLLAKIKNDVRTFLQSNEEIGCVIAVPSYFNETERKSYLIAAGIARLDCHFFIKETTAVAINYSFHRKFTLPINVIFIDFGQCSVQVSACKFSERQLEVIEEMSELIGGRDIDELLAEYVIDNFKIIGANRRCKMFCVQLLKDVEDLKKRMTSDVDLLRLNINHLLVRDEIFMKRADMENICAPLFNQIEILMQLFLERSKLNLEDIHSIEIVGGSSRIPIFGEIVEKVFGKKPIATMNRDESVARGCLFKSTMSIKRKSFKIKEKPFDNDTKQLTSTQIRDYIRIFQIHKTLKCDPFDALHVTDHQFLEYVEIEKKLAKFDSNEEKRRNARNNLEAFLSEHMTLPGGALYNTDPRRAKELSDLRMWTDGTKDEYDNLLAYWMNEVEKIKNGNSMEEEQIKDQHQSSDDFEYTVTPKVKLYDVSETTIKKPILQDDVKIQPRLQHTRKSHSILKVPNRKIDSYVGSSKKSYAISQDINVPKNRNRTDGNKNQIIKDHRSEKQKKARWCCFL